MPVGLPSSFAARTNTKEHAAPLDLPGFLRSFLDANILKIGTLLHDTPQTTAEMNAFTQSVREDTVKRERQWAEWDAQAAKLKDEGNESFSSGDFKTAYVAYSACIRLSPNEPLFAMNRAAAALSACSSVSLRSLALTIYSAQS